jgi:hypothetical protein
MRLFLAAAAFAAAAVGQCTVAWAPFAGPSSGVRALAVLPNGDLVAVGDFLAVGPVAAQRAARWDGAQWHAMGGGLPWSTWAVETLADGSVVAGGMFGGLMRWNGTAWSQLGALQPFALDLQALPGGGVAVAGSFPIPGGGNAAIWTGSSWQPLGPLNGDSLAVCRLANGDLVFGGSFTTAGGVPASAIARFDGAQWHAFGGGMNDLVIALAAHPDGSVYAGGNFTAAGGQAAAHIARWNGAQWQPLGAGVDGSVLCIAVMPDGDVVVGGDFDHAGGAPAAGIARWDGASWSAFAGGIDANGIVWDVLPPLREAAIVGGAFQTAGGLATPNLARLGSACGPTAVDLGGGCAGASARVARWPWLGGAMEVAASGLPPLAFAVAVTGLAAVNVPLAGLAPNAPPGCSLLVAPDLLEASVAVAGTAQSAVPIPLRTALLGQSLRQQIVGLAFDANGQWTSTTSTNALLATIGAF